MTPGCAALMHREQAALCLSCSGHCETARPRADRPSPRSQRRKRLGISSGSRRLASWRACGRRALSSRSRGSPKASFAASKNALRFPSWSQERGRQGVGGGDGVDNDRRRRTTTTTTSRREDPTSTHQRRESCWPKKSPRPPGPPPMARSRRC